MDGFDRIVGEGYSGTSGRAKRRDSLFLAARFRLSGRSDDITVRIRNLSEGGVMVELPHPPADGSAVEVEIRGIGWVAGSIAWIAQGRVGIAFDVPIDPLRARTPIGRRGEG